MSEATAKPFGETLRGLREEAELSQPQLARQVPISQASLSRYENGKQTPDRSVTKRLDDVLRADGRLLATRKAAQDVFAFDGADRQRLAHVARKPRAVDRATVDALGTVLASTRRLEDIVGVAPVLQPVRGHLTYLAALAGEARGVIRRDVVDQAGQWSQYIGWLCIAGEHYDEANQWFSQSLEWAVEAGDDDLAATVWSFKGHLAWLMGKVGPTIGLSQVARRYRGIYAGQTAYDALQEARGHAAVGDVYQVDRLVDESYQLSERALAELPGAPPWHYYRSPAFWELERGRALHRVPGRAPKAVELLTAGLDALPAEQRAADWVTAYRRDLDAARRV